MLEYLIENDLVVNQEIETAEILINAFRKQKSFNFSYDYEKPVVDGGKQDNHWEEIIDSQRDWINLEKILLDKAEIIEKYLCVEKSIEMIQEELGDSFLQVVNDILLIINILTRRRLSDYNLIILELNKKVQEFGYINTCNKVNMNYRTLQNILNGKKNIRLDNLERLLSFFNINNIYR